MNITACYPGIHLTLYEIEYNTNKKEIAQIIKKTGYNRFHHIWIRARNGFDIANLRYEIEMGRLKLEYSAEIATSAFIHIKILRGRRKNDEVYIHAGSQIVRNKNQNKNRRKCHEHDQ